MCEKSSVQWGFVSPINLTLCAALDAQILDVASVVLKTVLISLKLEKLLATCYAEKLNCNFLRYFF